MYSLYPLDTVKEEPGTFLLWYAWDDGFNNSEWRPVVALFLDEVSRLGHEVLPLPSPPFHPGEDFIEISYLVGGVRTTFASDLLLSLITIRAEDPTLLRGVWNLIGAKIGWA